MKNLDIILDTFLDHYNTCKNDPESIILQKSNYTTLKAPLFVSWEITSNCNLSCVHCRAYNNLSKNNIASLPTLDKYKEVIQYFHESEIYRVGITGGEPFTHPLILEILKELKKYRIQLIIYTNGTLLTENICNQLQEILDEYDIIHFSLDGGDVSSNDSQRGNGSFEKAINGLRLLSNRKINIRLNIVPTTLNFMSIEKLAHIALNYNVKEFGATPLMTAGRAKENLHIPNPDELMKIELKVVNLLKNSKTKYIGGISGAIHTYLNYPQVLENITQIKRKTISKKICDAGTRKIFIDAAGYVYPCGLFASSFNYVQGNIFNETLSDIWNKKSWNIFREGISVHDTCKSCKLLSFCNGGCPALTFLHTNSLVGVDPRCSKFHNNEKNNLP